MTRTENEFSYVCQETVQSLRRALRSGLSVPIAVPNFDMVRAAAAYKTTVLLECTVPSQLLTVQVVLLASGSTPEEFAFVGRANGRIVTVSVSRSHGVVRNGRPQAICVGWPVLVLHTVRGE